MPKLTDTQLIVLSSAAGAEDGLARRPANMTSATAAKVAASLAGKGLAREIRAKPDTPVWREDTEGRAFSLKITRAGRDAIGIIDDDETIATDPAEAGRSRRAASNRRQPDRRRAASAIPLLSPAATHRHAISNTQSTIRPPWLEEGGDHRSSHAGRKEQASAI